MTVIIHHRSICCGKKSDFRKTVSVTCNRCKQFHVEALQLIAFCTDDRLFNVFQMNILYDTHIKKSETYFIVCSQISPFIDHV